MLSTVNQVQEFLPCCRLLTRIKKSLYAVCCLPSLRHLTMLSVVNQVLRNLSHSFDLSSAVCLQAFIFCYIHMTFMFVLSVIWTVLKSVKQSFVVFHCITTSKDRYTNCCLSAFF